MKSWPASSSICFRIYPLSFIILLKHFHLAMVLKDLLYEGIIQHFKMFFLHDLNSLTKKLPIITQMDDADVAFRLFVNSPSSTILPHHVLDDQTLRLLQNICWTNGPHEMNSPITLKRTSDALCTFESGQAYAHGMNMYWISSLPLPMTCGLPWIHPNSKTSLLL